MPRPATVATPKTKTYPRGRYFEREAGPEMPIDAAERLGAEFTRAQGQKTGHEWALMHDERGRVLARISSAQKHFVEFSPGMTPEMYSPDYRITFHHNHPSSSSFSVADVRAFKTAPGLDKLFAHGHDGSTYTMRVLDRDAIAAATERAERRASGVISSSVARGVISAQDAPYLVAHMRMRILSDLGLVSYQYRLAGKTAEMFVKYPDLENRIAYIVGSW